MRQVLRIPSDPGRQRAVLVVLIHRAEVAPRRFMAEQLGYAGLKVNAEPDPLQQEVTGTRGRVRDAGAGSDPWRRKEKSNQAGREQHAIRLVTGKVLQR